MKFNEVFNNIGNKIEKKIGNSKIVKNPIFLVIGLIILVAIIILIYFIFLKYSPIMNFKYGGYAVSGKEITENLTGDISDTKDKNIELTKIEEQGTIFKKLNSFFVGSKEKREINLNYPIYINENSSLYNLAEDATLISKDFEEIAGYPNLSIAEGKVYDGNNLERTDAKEYIFVKTSDNIFINLQEIKINTAANEYTIPINSIISFTENEIRYYNVKNNVLVFNVINDVDSNSNVQIVENNYTYKELLTKLGILKDENAQSNDNNEQTNEEQENTTNIETINTGSEENDDNNNNNNSENNNAESSVDNNDTTTNPNAYVKPEVSCDDFTAEVYTATSTLHIKDPAARIIEAPTFEVYRDGKIYLRRIYTNSGALQITGLIPDTEFKIIGKYVYLNENGQKIENQFYEGTFTTKGYDSLGSIDIQKENGDIFSNKIQLQKVKITSDLNAEVIKGINQVEIVTGDIRTVLKNSQVNDLLQGKEVTIESSEGLESDSKISYEIKFYDRNGVELKVNNNKGETRTSKQEPAVQVSIKEQNIVSVTLGLRLTNKDNVELQNYKYVVTKPNGETVREEKLAENEKELLLEDLDQNQYYTIKIYADFDLNDNKGMQPNVEIGSLVFATQPISTLGSLEFKVENKELTGNSSTIDYTIDEDRTDKRLIQILNELTINIVEQPKNEDNNNTETNNIDANNIDDNNASDNTNKEPVVVYTNTLTGDEITNLQQGNTKEIKYENLKSNTRYTIEISGNIKLGKTQESIPITYSYKEFTTLKIPAKVDIKNQFVTGNLIDFDVRIEDIDKSVLNEKVRMELRDDKGNLIDLQEIETNQDYIRKTYEKLEENKTYKLSFYADQYNEGSTDETYKVNYLIKELEIVTEPGISGSVGLTELTRKATGKNLVDMSSETKWYVYPNFNTGDYYGKEYDPETKVLTLGGHGNWRRAVYDLREYAGQEVTMSFKAKNVNGSQSTYIQNSKTDTNRTKIEGLTNDWQDFQYTLTVDSTGYLGFYIQGGNGIQIKELQIELGNKKTNYEEYKYTLESKYSINLEDKRNEITTNDYYLKIYEDGNLLKTDRYEEIPESNIITNAIKSYDTESGKQYKVELVIKVNDREYTISSLEYNTKDTEEIKGIYNKEDFLEVQPRGHYIVLGDIDLTGASGNQCRFGINFSFEGKIDFNGQKLILNNKTHNVFNTLSKDAVIENLVYDLHFVNYNGNFMGVVGNNYGTLTNIEINIYADQDFVSSKSNNYYFLIAYNFAVLDKFVVNIRNELNIIRLFAMVGQNEGEIKNGYAVGQKINSNYAIEDNLDKRIGVICLTDRFNGLIKNVYSTIDIDLSNGNYNKNVSPLIAIAGTSSNMMNIYSTGNITNANYSYGINVSTIGTSSYYNYKIENSYYMSKDLYNVGYDKKTTRLALYDTGFQSKILNDDNSFSIDEYVNNGYYPQLILNDCMPPQDYIKLPQVQDADLPDIIDTNILEQTSSSAKVKFIVNNPSAETITSIQIQNLTCTIDSQEYENGKSEVVATLSNPKICVSEYSVMSISTKGAFNKEYTRTFQNRERLLQLDMYKEIRTIDEWNSINKSLTENYILMNDLDFINNGNLAKIGGSYTGKINGNNYTIKNIQIQNGSIFNSLSNTSKISNLNIQNFQQTGSYYSIILTLNGELNNVHATDVKLEKTTNTTDNHQGGLVSVSYGNIYNSSVSNLEIKNHTLSTITRVGGLVGIAIGGYIENCYVQNANIEVKENLNYDGVGGLIGNIQNEKTVVENCYVTGVINTDSSVGGIVGYNNGKNISKCYSAIDIIGENNDVGGIIANNHNNAIVQNNLFLGNIYSSGENNKTDAICASKDLKDNNYIYEGVTVNGYLIQDKNKLVTKEELEKESTYLDKIGLGTEFSYEGIESGKLPLLYKKGTQELLPGQESINIPEKSKINIESVESEKSNVNEMQAIVTIDNPEEKEITNINIENMNILSKSILTRNGKTYVTLSAKPKAFSDSYKINKIEYLENSSTKQIQTSAKIQIKFYKELYNISDWQSIEVGTYQNYMLMNDIDFKNMENIKYNVTMQELITNNNVQYTLKNIKLNLKDDYTGLIRKINTVKNINFEDIEIDNSTSGSNIGVIISAKNVNDCAFVNTTINAKSADYVGCLATANGSVRDISIKDINIVGNNYIGAIIPSARDSGLSLKNISAENVNVTGNKDVGGLFGYLEAIVNNNNNNIININVTGNQNVGGIVGRTSSRSDAIPYCNAKEVTVIGKDYVGGIVGQGSVLGSRLTDSKVYGDNYVGGIAGNLYNSQNIGNYVYNVEIEGNYDRIGGIAGETTDEDCLNNQVKNSNIKGRNYIGGISGYSLEGNTNTYTNSVENVEITGSEQYVGGTVGYATASNIYSNYSINSNIIGKSKVGGIIGEIANGNVYKNYTNNNVKAEEDVGGLIGNLNNERMTNQTYIISVYYNYVANSNITGTRNIGGLIGVIAKELNSDGYYYSNYVQADLNSNNNTVSLGIGSNKNQNLKLKDTYYYKYSSINGENPTAQNEVFILQDNYLTENDLKQQSTYTSKLKWSTADWNFNVLSNGKYPIINSNNLTDQKGIDIPKDAEHIIGTSGINMMSLDKDKEQTQIDTLETTETPERSFEYDNKQIQTYSTYSIITSSDGSSVKRNTKLYVKDNTLYAIPTLITTNSNGEEIAPVADNLILDSYNGKEYETVLGSDGKIYDLKEPITYPDNFVNKDIESIGNNLNSDTKEVEVSYKNGDKVKFNYQTGEVITSSKNTSEQKGLIEYIGEKISEIGSGSATSSAEEISSKYEESKELQSKLEKTPVEEAIEQQNSSANSGASSGSSSSGSISLNNSGSSDSSTGAGSSSATTTETNGTNNSGKEKTYISMYNEETGNYEIYDEEELLDTTKEEVVSENEKISANNLNKYYASEGNTKNRSFGILWIVLSIIGIGIILFVLKKNLKKKN